MDFYKSTRGMSPDAVAKAVEEEFEGLHYINEKLLRKLTNTTDPEKDISNVTHLDITVDAKEHSIPRIGKILPNLKSLKLVDSYVSGFRDLGTSLRFLRVLWAPRAGISDLDGISALPSLRELYICFNNVSDLTPLAMHERIQVLDMEGNCVDDLDQLGQLGTCMELTTLSLSENPIAKVKEYRRVVLKMIPHLDMLDDQPYNNNERQEIMDGDSYDEICDDYNNTINKNKEAQRALVTEKLRHKGSRSQMDNNAGSEKWAKKSSDSKMSGRGGGPRGRSNSNGSSFRRFKESNSGKALTAQPPSPTNDNNSDNHISSSSSDLTHGAEVVFAGNAVRALRRRRNEQDNMSYKGPVRASLKKFNDRMRNDPRLRINSMSNNNNNNGGSSKTNGDNNGKKDTRISIMATLDRVMQMEERMNDASISEKTKQEVLSELAKWKMDAEIIQKRKVSYKKSDTINERPQTARGVSKEHKRKNLDVDTIRPRSSQGLNRSASTAVISNNKNNRKNKSKKNMKLVLNKNSLSDGEYDSADDDDGKEGYDEIFRKNRNIVPGSPEWRRIRERRTRHQAFLKDTEKMKKEKAERKRQRKLERRQQQQQLYNSEEDEDYNNNRKKSNSISKRSSSSSSSSSSYDRKTNERIVTPEKQKIRSNFTVLSSGRKNKRQPGEMLDILVNWKENDNQTKKGKSKNKGKPSAKLRDKKKPPSDEEDDISVIKNKLNNDDTPDTNWRNERAKRKQRNKNEFSKLKQVSTTETTGDVLDISTGSETDMDLQIEEMNSRIKDMEAWGNSQGFKSPPSPTQLIANTKINYNIDDAIEEEAGEEDEEEEGGKISSPSTKSNSPKDNGDNDSVHSQDNHGLPTNDNAGSKKSGKISSSSFGAAVERDDLDLIELLKVKPKRVPELRTHDGFQKFFQGIEEKRMKRLLERAFEDLPSKVSRKKIKRRMALMEGFLRK